MVNDEHNLVLSIIHIAIYSLLFMLSKCSLFTLLLQLSFEAYKLNTSCSKILEFSRLNILGHQNKSKTFSFSLQNSEDDKPSQNMLWTILTLLTRYLKLLESMFTQNCTRFISRFVYVFLSGQNRILRNEKNFSWEIVSSAHNFDQTVNLQSTKNFQFQRT